MSCGGFEPDSLDECIKVIDDPVVEAVEKRPLLVRDSGIGANGAEETRGKRSNSFRNTRQTEYPCGRS